MATTGAAPQPGQRRLTRSKTKLQQRLEDSARYDGTARSLDFWGRCTSACLVGSSVKHAGITCIASSCWQMPYASVVALAALHSNSQDVLDVAPVGCELKHLLLCHLP